MGRVGAVILAAGGSLRLGRPKSLIAFRGETLIQRAVRAVEGAGCAPIVVVAGDIASEIRNHLRETSADVVENCDWRLGIGTSIRRGVHELGKSVDAIVLLACDQPFIDAGVVQSLVATHEKTGQPIIASRYADTLGVPALFHRSQFEALRALPDEAGAKALIVAQPNAVSSIAFEQGAIDIDTPEDLERLTSL